jgi:hypothetical protein
MNHRWNGQSTEEIWLLETDKVIRYLGEAAKAGLARIRAEAARNTLVAMLWDRMNR